MSTAEHQMPDSLPFDAIQFSGDRDARLAIEADADLMKKIKWAQPKGGLGEIRRKLLSQAIRVDTRILPALAKAFSDVKNRAQIDQPLEAYVCASSEINAAVIPGRDRTMVLLTSGIVERLNPEELDFAIGHELGHASYGHLDMPVDAVIANSSDLLPRQAMQLLAWRRKAEISADRAGLLCCGSLQTAATTMFKILSGLSIADLRVDPQDLAGQWNELAQEIVRGEQKEDHWLATHPFPPLRMQALLAFDQSSDGRHFMDAASDVRLMATVDQKIERMLAMMDPLARDTRSKQGCGDPYLERFLLWGGLYIAAIHGGIDDSELANLASLVGDDALNKITIERSVDAAPQYRDQFLQAMKEREKTLSALELHRIFSGLVIIAQADGSVDQPEIEALQELTRACGVSEDFINTLIQ